MTRKGPWTAAENAELFRMKAEKYPVEVIANKVGRSYQATVERWRWINKSEEKKAARRGQINLARHLNGTHPKKAYIPSAGKRPYATAASRPALDMLEEAQKRLYAPRTISQQLLGDPPPGYSALDRKRQGLPA